MNEKLIKQANGEIKVSFELNLEASLEDVWNLLTTNAGLAQWFHELEVGELGEEGYFNFIMTPTERIKMPILKYIKETKIGFEWDQDLVLFQLEPLDNDNVKLIFSEELKNITEHTPRDIAGWNLCLRRIQLVLIKKIETPVNQDEFDDLVEKYKSELGKLEQN